MRQPRKRRWARWVMMTQEQDCRSLCLLARQDGLAVISADRPGMCMWNALALYGTSEAMQTVERHWTTLGLQWYRRRPLGAWPAVQLLRKGWAEYTVNWEEQQKEQEDEQAHRLAASAAGSTRHDPDRS